jgi:hypothetical protein
LVITPDSHQAAQIGGSARVLPDLLSSLSVMLSLDMPDAVHRFDAAGLVWRSPPGEVPVDAANERPGHRGLDPA